MCRGQVPRSHLGAQALTGCEGQGRTRSGSPGHCPGTRSRGPRTPRRDRAARWAASCGGRGRLADTSVSAEARGTKRARQRRGQHLSLLPLPPLFSAEAAAAANCHGHQVTAARRQFWRAGREDAGAQEPRRDVRGPNGTKGIWSEGGGAMEAEGTREGWALGVRERPNKGCAGWGREEEQGGVEIEGDCGEMRGAQRGRGW